MIALRWSTCLTTPVFDLSKRSTRSGLCLWISLKTIWASSDLLVAANWRLLERSSCSSFRTSIWKDSKIFPAVSWLGGTSGILAGAPNTWLLSFCHHVEIAGNLLLWECCSTTKFHGHDHCQGSDVLWIYYKTAVSWADETNVHVAGRFQRTLVGHLTLFLSWLGSFGTA